MVPWARCLRCMPQLSVVITEGGNYIELSSISSVCQESRNYISQPVGRLSPGVSVHMLSLCREQSRQTPPYRVIFMHCPLLRQCLALRKVGEIVVINYRPMDNRGSDCWWFIERSMWSHNCAFHWVDEVNLAAVKVDRAYKVPEWWNGKLTINLVCTPLISEMVMVNECH